MTGNKLKNVFFPFNEWIIKYVEATDFQEATEIRTSPHFISAQISFTVFTSTSLFFRIMKTRKVAVPGRWQARKAPSAKYIYAGSVCFSF